MTLHGRPDRRRRDRRRSVDPGQPVAHSSHRGDAGAGDVLLDEPPPQALHVGGHPVLLTMAGAEHDLRQVVGEDGVVGRARRSRSRRYWAMVRTRTRPAWLISHDSSWTTRRGSGTALPPARARRLRARSRLHAASPEPPCDRAPAPDRSSRARARRAHVDGSGQRRLPEISCHALRVTRHTPSTKGQVPRRSGTARERVHMPSRHCPPSRPTSPCPRRRSRT